MVLTDFEVHLNVLVLILKDSHVHFDAKIDNHRLQLNYELMLKEL
jgi:hypothetical protein